MEKFRLFLKKKALPFVLAVLCGTALLMGLDAFTNGIPPWGVPKPEEVRSVVLSWPQKSPEPKTLTDPEDIDLAVHLTGFLSYVPLKGTDAKAEPLVTITYITKDGGSYTLSANEATLWKGDSTHALRQKGAFLKMTEGLFFLKETVEP